MDAAAYGLGMTDEFRGTGVWRDLKVKREPEEGGGNSESSEGKEEEALPKTMETTTSQK